MSTPPFPGLPELSRKEGCPCGRLFVTEWGLKGKSVTLDFKGAFGILKSPNHQRRFRRLCHAPHGKKSGFLCFLPPLRPNFWALVHIGKATSSIREDWRLW